MSLHLVRLPVDRRMLAGFAVSAGASDDDGGYALHLALRRRFGAAGPQPFRVLEGQGDALSLLGYTTDADGLRDAAALPPAGPLLDHLFGPPELRPMPVAWRAGQRLGFDLRVRPVVRFSKRLVAARSELPAAQAKDGWWARAGEVDAWIAGRTRGGDGGLWTEGGDAEAIRAAIQASPTREEAYLAWLATRLAGAAELESAELRQFRRTRTCRSTHGRPGRPSAEGPDAIMAGTLVVADPDAFARMLARGVGRHVAFGFGMLLLSPPGRPG